jgi:putative ABC transport system ATP-binding protein
MAAGAPPTTAARSAAGHPLIAFRNVSRIYGVGKTPVRAMTAVNLEIAQGEQVAIVGPSGSGKSTLMNIMGLLDRPTEGDFFFDGVHVDRLSIEQKADIRGCTMGFVFQQFHLIEHLSAGQNVELPLRYQQVDAAQRNAQVLASLQAVGLAHRLWHRPSQLSGGEKQRVAIARALVSNPKLILADEPTGALDSVNGLAVLQLMRDLSQQMGATLIIITHDPSLANQLPRCIRLLDGRIQSDTQIAPGLATNS